MSRYILFGTISIALSGIVWAISASLITALSTQLASFLFICLVFILPNRRVQEKEADHVGLIMLAKVISI